MAGAAEVLFPVLFTSFFLFILLLSLLELLGKVYVSYRVLDRKDLTDEQRLIFLAATWFIPLAWIVYLLLGEQKTGDLFTEVEFL